MISSHLSDNVIAHYKINLMVSLLHFTFMQKVKIESESFKYILVVLLFGFKWHKDRNHLFRVLLKSVSYVFRGFVTEWSETLRGKIGKKKTSVFWENRLFWLSNLKQKGRRHYWQRISKSMTWNECEILVGQIVLNVCVHECVDRE